MALYKHVANKDELLDGMIDEVVAEIEPPLEGADWKTTMRERILSARRALLRHPWATRVLESRGEPTPLVIGYIDSMMGVFLDGGFSVDLMHHAMHVMGSRILGFSQELFDDTANIPDEEAAAMWSQVADVYPNIAKLIPVALDTHEGPVVGGGCDDQFEFEFALDLVLDGLERLREREAAGQG
jgi:AcrR family transcriptional regulator